ncbi:MAG: cyclic nucleotide-binding domain-containing protein [Oligoflexia bacterium]|nr:cyclic nucleotide-binding domain-containing protein [Oligoflexia bacterium]MBF0364782.1 cyclic nucleotide-binding domain-containing protein [Oligoflexia bacterium]
MQEKSKKNSSGPLLKANKGIIGIPQKFSNPKDNLILAQDEVLFSEGEELMGLYIITRGCVQLLKKSHSGRLLPVSILKNKDFIGAEEVFENRKTTTSAVALEDTEITVIAKSDIQEILQILPEWTSKLMLTLTSRLAKICDVLAEHSIADERLTVYKIFTQEHEANFKNIIKKYKENASSQS